MIGKLALFLVGMLVLPMGCGPSDPAALARRSVQYYTKAVQSYQRQIQKNPSAEFPRLQLARFHIQNKQYREALEILAPLPSPASRELAAAALFYEGDTTASLELFEKLDKEALLFAPQSLLVYGRVLEEKNLYDQALKVYSRIEREPFSKEAAARTNKINLAVNSLALDKETASLIAEARARAYPESPAAVILKADEEITITPDNKEISRVHYLVLIKEERAKEAFGEVQLGYDSTYEKVDLKFARTITDDGKIIEVGKKNIRDVSRYLNFPLYSNARVLIVSMPELKVGSVIEYEAQIVSSKLIADKHYSFRYALKDKYPIGQARFTLRVPQESPLRYKIINEQYVPSGLDLKPQIGVEPGIKIYSWVFRDVPQIMDEPARNPDSEINPAILVSSFSDWREIFSWWDTLYKDKLALNPEMKSLVRELTKDKQTARGKAEALYEFCATQIRYVGIEYGEAGYTPHFAEDIFVNRYGDCKDQAVLLTALLREAGLKAYPVLIPTRDVPGLQKDFPAVLFDHAITAVELEDGLVFMDTTAEVVGFGDLPAQDQDRNVLVFSEPEGIVARTALNTSNSIHYSMDLVLINSEDALVSRRVSAEGLFAAQQRAYFKYSEPYILEQNIIERIKRLCPSGELVEYAVEGNNSLQQQPVLSYRFNAPFFLSRAGTLRVVPLLGEISPREEWIVQDRREYPLDFRMLQTLTSAITLRLPPGVRVHHLPQKFAISSKWFDFYVDYKTRIDTIYYTEELRIKKKQVDPGEYKEFKGQMSKVLNALREQIILKAGKQ